MIVKNTPKRLPCRRRCRCTSGAGWSPSSWPSFGARRRTGCRTCPPLRPSSCAWPGGGGGGQKQRIRITFWSTKIPSRHLPLLLEVLERNSGVKPGQSSWSGDGRGKNAGDQKNERGERKTERERREQRQFPTACQEGSSQMRANRGKAERRGSCCPSQRPAAPTTAVAARRGRLCQLLLLLLK